LQYAVFYPIKEYEIYNFKNKSKNIVKRFEEIGWPDPFPNPQRMYKPPFREPIIYPADY